MRIAIIIVLAISTLVLGRLAFSTPDIRAEIRAEVQETLETCNKAHDEVKTASEQACGALQDKYNLEYVCTANEVGQGVCWVEVH